MSLTFNLRWCCGLSKRNRMPWMGWAMGRVYNFNGKYIRFNRMWHLKRNWSACIEHHEKYFSYVVELNERQNQKEAHILLLN